MKWMVFPVCWTFFCGSAWAGTAIHTCTMTSTGSGGWIPKQVEFSYDEARASGTVSDTLSENFRKAPVVVSVRRLGPDRIELQWSPGAFPTTVRGRSSEVRYTMLFRPSKNRVELAADVDEGDRRAFSRGKCTVKK